MNFFVCKITGSVLAICDKTVKKMLQPEILPKTCVPHLSCPF